RPEMLVLPAHLLVAPKTILQPLQLKLGSLPRTMSSTNPVTLHLVQIFKVPNRLNLLFCLNQFLLIVMKLLPQVSLVTLHSCPKTLSHLTLLPLNPYLPQALASPAFLSA